MRAVALHFGLLRRGSFGLSLRFLPLWTHPEHPERTHRRLRIHELIAGAVPLREDIFDAGEFEDGTERAAGDDPCSLPCGKEPDTCGFEFHVHFVGNCSADEGHLDHLATCLRGRLLHRSLHLRRLADTDTDFALAITNDDRHAETHAATPFHDTRDTCDLQNVFVILLGFTALAGSAIITSGFGHN